METPLHAAAQRDSVGIAKLLLEYGADINAKNLSFKRPVEVAPPGGLTEGFLLIYEGEGPFLYLLIILHFTTFNK